MGFYCVTLVVCSFVLAAGIGDGLTKMAAQIGRIAECIEEAKNESR